MTGADLLESIVAATRHEVEQRERQRNATELARAAAESTPRAEAFHEALRSVDVLNVMAECKRRSPSHGVLREVYDAGAVAAAVCGGWGCGDLSADRTRVF